jgi:TetR/AcrR family transcriptional regulator
MAARRYDPEGTRAAILEAAHRIFVEKGTGDAALSEIAQLSGVTKSLIHHHFGSKDALWTEVKRAAFEPFFSGILGIIRGDQSDMDALEQVIRFMFGYLRDHPDIARLMARMRVEHGEVHTDLEQCVGVEGMQRIAKAQAAGLIRPDLSPATIQLAFVSLATGWSQHRHVVECWPFPDADLETIEAQYLDEVLRLFLDGVRTP